MQEIFSISKKVEEQAELNLGETNHFYRRWWGTLKCSNKFICRLHSLQLYRKARRPKFSRMPLFCHCILQEVTTKIWTIQQVPKLSLNLLLRSHSLAMSLNHDRIIALSDSTPIKLLYTMEGRCAQICLFILKNSCNQYFFRLMGTVSPVNFTVYND